MVRNWGFPKLGPVLSTVASYPGHVGGGKSGLVSTVCACANDSGNFLRTSPIMDKLHVVAMRRNNQTRYTAYSVAADFTRRWLPLSGLNTFTSFDAPSRDMCGWSMHIEV